MSTFDLRSVELFSGLDDAALDRLIGDLTVCSLGRSQTLFDEGDPGDAAYIVTSGEIEILKASADRDVRIAVSGPGVIVGEMSLLTGEPRNATARALVDTELVTIPKASLDALVDADTEVIVDFTVADAARTTLPFVAGHGIHAVVDRKSVV